MGILGLTYSQSGGWTQGSITIKGVKQVVRPSISVTCCFSIRSWQFMKPLLINFVLYYWKMSFVDGKQGPLLISSNIFTMSWIYPLIIFSH